MTLQVNFFAFVAQEVRMGLARLGMRSLDELVGRADLLHQKDDLKLGKTSGLDMSFLTTYAGHEPGNSTQRRNNKVLLVTVHASASSSSCRHDSVLHVWVCQPACHHAGVTGYSMYGFVRQYVKCRDDRLAPPCMHLSTELSVPDVNPDFHLRARLSCALESLPWPCCDTDNPCLLATSFTNQVV